MLRVLFRRGGFLHMHLLLLLHSACLFQSVLSNKAAPLLAAMFPAPQSCRAPFYPSFAPLHMGLPPLTPRLGGFRDDGSCGVVALGDPTPLLQRGTPLCTNMQWLLMVFVLRSGGQSDVMGQLCRNAVMWCLQRAPALLLVVGSLRCSACRQ